MAKSKRTKRRTTPKRSTAKKRPPTNQTGEVRTGWLPDRVARLTRVWWRPCPKRLLLIRPKVSGDDYTELGSFNWAEDVKTKANAEGWDVTDLDANNATRAKIENALNTGKPHLVIHYDHGAAFTLWGQKNNYFEPGLDDTNIALASGKFVSTVSCLSASGLGPSAITKGVVSYVGYTDLHSFWIHRSTEFGQASNAANFALLEGKTVQEAFDAGWAAYDQLYNDLMTAGDLLAAATALHDRDCLALLGSASSTAPPTCACSFGLPIHCRIGLPDSKCRGLPLYQCLPGLPNVPCVYGNPVTRCWGGAPLVECARGLPGGILCALGLPGSLPVCGKGPDGCHAGPPLILQDLFKDYPVDVVIVDRAKIPSSMRKAFDSMISRMQREVR